MPKSVRPETKEAPPAMNTELAEKQTIPVAVNVPDAIERVD
jgi:hypothetical protein